MILMHFLRALADLGLYYAFAGAIAWCFGGSLALAALLLQSGCFALSSALRAKRWARLLALLPAAGFFLLPGGSWADRAAALPGLAYLLCLAWTDGYELSWGRQADVFSAYWSFLVFAPVFALCWDWQGVLNQGIPAMLLAAAASVLLLRSIRHGPKVYRQRSYQILNWISVAMVLVLAWLASTDWFLAGVGYLYTHLVVPVMLGLAMLIGLIAMVLIAPLQLLAHQQREKYIPPSRGTLLAEAEGEMWAAGGPLDTLLPLLGALLAVAAVALFFRWLMRRRGAEPEQSLGPGAARTFHPEEPRRPRRQALPYTYAGRIRGQYRQFLKHCRKRGIELEPADTSTEVSRKALRHLPGQAERLEEFRLLYQRARYRGEATREELHQAKRLYSQLKKEL